MSARLDALRRQFDEVRSGIDSIEANPAGDNGDLSADQQSQVDTLFARADELKTEIEPLARREQSLAATASVLASLPNAPRSAPIARGQLRELTAGEYFSAFARAAEGDTDAAAMIARTVADQLTTDNPGILPEPILGPLIKLADSSRPCFASLTSRPMPAKGKTFTRPRVTQRVLVDEQLTEKTQVGSRKMTITGDEVTKRTFGGVLDVSQQDIDWTDPAILQIAIQDFFDYYAEVTEGEATTFLDTTSPFPTGGWTGTDPGTIVSSITAGVTTVYNNSKRMPDTFWLGLDVAMAVAGTTNTDDTVTAISLVRRALADVGLSLNFVICPQFAANTRIVGVSGLIEGYEKQNGIVQAVNVPLLGLDIGYSGYIAFYTPHVSNVAVAGVKLV